MVWSGSATHPSNCTRVWCSKYTQKHPPDFPWEAEVRRPSPGPEARPKFLDLLPYSRISHTVCWASTRYFCCHFATSGALRASNQRINVGMSEIGLSLVTFFGIKKHIAVHACCGHFQKKKNSTTSPLVSFVTFRWTLGWKPSHPTPVFALYSFDTFSNPNSFTLGSASSHFFNSSFSDGLSSKI